LGLQRANKSPSQDGVTMHRVSLKDQYLTSVTAYADTHSLTIEEACKALAIQALREREKKRLELNHYSNVVHFRGAK